VRVLTRIVVTTPAQACEITRSRITSVCRFRTLSLGIWIVHTCPKFPQLLMERTFTAAGCRVSPSAPTPA